MKIAYGYNGVDEDEGLYATAAEATRFFDETAMLGAWLVDSFPLCKSSHSSLHFILTYTCLVKYVPSWFPGAGFKRYAARGRVVTTKTVNAPFDEVKRHVVRPPLFFSLFRVLHNPYIFRGLLQEQGTAGGSFCSMLLQDGNCDAETEDCIKWSAAGIFAGKCHS